MRQGFAQKAQDPFFIINHQYRWHRASSIVRDRLTGVHPDIPRVG
jgi:hypothetical protein